jgi:DNA-binding NarL/FixJ family response regulator
MIRVLIADDHPLVRRGIRELLQAEPDMVVTGEAATATELLTLVGRVPWDVAVIDLRIPDNNGLDSLVSIKKLHPKRSVLILSMYPEDQYGKRALKAGASGYVAKESAAEELLVAVRKVFAGGRHVSQKLAESLARDIGAGEGAPHEALSNRELEVLRQIGSGKAVGEIAEVMSLSVKTVSTYRARILEKMRMKHNAELTRYAIEHHLVD